MPFNWNNVEDVVDLQARPRCAPQKPRSSRLEKHEAKQAKAREDVKLRKVIRKRDKDKCRCCGKPCVWDAPSFAERAHVHHLVFRSASKSLQDAPANLITVCGICHARIHSREIEVIGTDATRPIGFKKVKPQPPTGSPT